MFVFGYGLPIIFFFFGWRRWQKTDFDLLTVTLLVAGVFISIVALINQPLLKILFRYWMKGAAVIGFAVTTLILSFIFFTMFATVGIVLRVLRKDLLRLRAEPQAGSYWIICAHKTQGPERFTQQF